MISLTRFFTQQLLFTKTTKLTAMNERRRKSLDNFSPACLLCLACEHDSGLVLQSLVHQCAPWIPPSHVSFPNKLFQTLSVQSSCDWCQASHLFIRWISIPPVASNLPVPIEYYDIPLAGQAMRFNVQVQIAKPSVHLRDQAVWLAHGKKTLQRRICILLRHCDVPDIVKLIVSFCATHAHEMCYWGISNNAEV